MVIIVNSFIGEIMKKIGEIMKKKLLTEVLALLTEKQLGEAFGVTPSRISQIKN